MKDGTSNVEALQSNMEVVEMSKKWVNMPIKAILHWGSFPIFSEISLKFHVTKTSKIFEQIKCITRVTFYILH